MALKNSVIDHDEYAIEGLDCPEDIKRIHGQQLALYARNFWKDPAKAKSELERKSGTYGIQENGPKLRTCFNCGDRYHLVASSQSSGIFSFPIWVASSLHFHLGFVGVLPKVLCIKAKYST